MADTDQKEAGLYSEAETVARREAALKVMLATPHKPHKSKDIPNADTNPARRSRD